MTAVEKIEKRINLVLAIQGEVASVNLVILVGFLGHDPEMKFFDDGACIGNISLATGESYTDRNGQKVQMTEWHKIVVRGKNAENCARYLHKGSQIYVECKLRTRKYQDRQGQERNVTEIHALRVQFLDRKADDVQQPDSSKSAASALGSESQTIDAYVF